jgi:hypothetical protein
MRYSLLWAMLLSITTAMPLGNILQSRQQQNGPGPRPAPRLEPSRPRPVGSRNGPDLEPPVVRPRPGGSRNGPALEPPVIRPRPGSSRNGPDLEPPIVRPRPSSDLRQARSASQHSAQRGRFELSTR